MEFPDRRGLHPAKNRRLCGLLKTFDSIWPVVKREKSAKKETFVKIALGFKENMGD